MMIKLRNIASSFLLILGMVLVVVQPVSAAVNCPTAIAHRGNAYYGSPTENSIGAFNASFASGSKWIETDVHFTSDNIPVLMHNSTVDGTTTGSGTISKMTAAQFTSLTMNDGQKAPSLDQALSLVRGYADRRIIMEIKVSLTSQQEQIIADKLRGLENQAYVNAFAARLSDIQQIKARNPLLNVSMLVYAPVFPVPAGISGQDMEYSYATAQRVAQLHAAGMTVRVWTSNSTASWESLRNMGVDAIMTNKVKANVEWLTSQGCPAAPTEQNPVVITEDVTETIDIPYEQMTVDDPSLPLGTSTVTQSGVNGAQTIVYTVTYTNGVETSRVVKSDQVTTQSINEVTHIGTGDPSDTTPVVTTEDATETNTIPFQYVTVNDPTLPIGTSKVTQTGINGTETTTYTVTYTDGVETSRVLKSAVVTSQPTNQVTAVGTMQSTPSVMQYVGNQSFETTLSGWGTATTASKNTRTIGGYEGSYAVRSINNSTSNTKHGIMASPAWIDGKTKSTTASKVYTASAWVKPDVAGQKISIYLREVNSAGSTVGSKTVTVTTTTTGWQLITHTYAALNTGSKLDFHLFSTNSAAQKGFLADILSLTTN